MSIDFAMLREYYENRLCDLRRTLPLFMLNGFVVGAALTEQLDRRWPNAGRYMIAAAAAISLGFVLASYRRMRRSAAAYKASLAQLRAIDPDLAQTVKRMFP